MHVVKIVRNCEDCGIEYRRAADTQDDWQDLRDGVNMGRCDECWREQIILMMEPA